MQAAEQYVGISYRQTSQLAGNFPRTVDLCCMSDDFLQPDEITFAVMLRGFGNQTPADWQKVDSVLTQMRMTYGVEPTASKLPVPSCHFVALAQSS